MKNKNYFNLMPHISRWLCSLLLLLGMWTTNAFAQPANNDCAGAITLTQNASCVTTAGTTVGATQTIAPSTCSGFTSSSALDVWYKFVATTTNPTITLVSTFDAVLELRSGACNGASVTCIDAGSGGETLLPTGLTIGTTYLIRLYGWAGATGTFTICVFGAPAGPANNDCAGAITLTQNASCVTTAGTTVGATQTIAPSTCSGFTSSSALDVWYKFVATTTNPTITLTSTFDAVLELRSGACNGASVTCIDAGSGGETLLPTGLTIGTTYLIRLYGWAGATGTFNICVFGAAAFNPCSSITTYSTCGTSTLASFGSSAGAYNPPSSSCGFSTPGEEKIYSFTPVTSGNYQISQTASSVGYIDYFYKAASGGCSGTGWTCIDDITGNNIGNALVNIALTSGVQYYFLLDPENAGAQTATFSIVCPAGFNPCSSITTYSTCGTSTLASFGSSAGAYNPPSSSCGFSTPGEEKIYSFTPVTSGNYQISQTASSVGYIDYFYKAASGGCSGTGWTCIDDITGNNIGNALVNIALTSGVQYYFLLDPENAGAQTATFSIVCPAGFNPCSSITTYSTCGTSTLASFGSSAGAYNPPSSSCGFSTPGEEKIYSFTPVTSGNYQISQTASSVGYIDYFYKAASGGCSGTGWTCIDDINGNNIGNALVNIALTSGVQYYFLLDPENAGAQTATFSIVCAVPPCSPAALTNGVAVSTSTYPTNYSFTNSTFYTAAVAIAPQGTDHDIALYTTGCQGGAVLASSVISSGSTVDYIIQGWQVSTQQFPSAQFNTTGTSSVEWEANVGTMILGTPVAGTIATTEVMDAYEAPSLTAGTLYNIKLTVSSGDCNLGFGIGTPSTTGWINRSSCTNVDANGAGLSESLCGYNPSTSGFPGIVIFNTQSPLATVASNYSLVIEAAANTMTSANSATICSGGPVSIALTNSGPASTFTWIAADNPNTTGESTTLQNTGTLSNTITNLTTSVQTVVYTVTPISAATGCSGTAQTVMVTVNPNPTPTITGNSTFCQGSSTQICAPAGLNSYSWSTGATTQCITVSTANTFTVTVTDANGCSGSTSRTTTVNPNPTPTITGNSTFCQGSSTQICAPAGLNSYSWSTGATTQCITVSTANTFTVTVTDANGCSGSTSRTTTVNPNPTPTITGNSTFCQGSSTQICAPAGLAGYSWSTGATTQCITVSTASTFTVTVTDANGCSGSASRTTTVNPLPSCLITGNSSICSGSTTQWCAPSGLASYLWSTGATTQCITLSTANTFTVTVTDGNGCSSSCNKTLTVNPLPSCLITGNSSICSGSSTQWCAPSGLASYLWSTGATTQCITLSTANTFTVTVTDGNGCSSSCNKTLTVNPLPSCLITGNSSICSGSSTQWCAPSGLASYLWSTGATTQCITLSTANTFTVTVTDGNGCSSSCNKTLTVNPLPSCLITGNSSICSGSSTQWCAPSGLASYLWSTGATTQCITLSTANTFTVTVTDGNGCSSSCNKTLTVNPLPSCLITGNSSICSGSSTQWCAPSGLASYLWSTGATTQCITLSTANTFTVTVTDGNGCSSSCNKTLTVNPLPSCLITGNSSICSGSSTQWCAPSGLASYLWSTGATTQCITVSTANTFTVTVTNSNGCSSSCNKTLTVNPNPTPTITGNSTFCQGSSTQICAPAGLAGYIWNTGATTQCITVNTANTFTVTVTDANGCTGSTSRTTTVNPLPTISTTGPLSLNNNVGLCSATVSNAQLMAQVTSVTGNPPPTVTFSPPAGSFPVGTTLVTATATNICGAPTSSFNVIVTDDEDPDIACPPPVVSVNTDPGVCYATGVALGSPVIGDNCAGSTVGNNAPLQFPQGGTYVTWEVTDASGNKADCQQLVSVTDNEPPHAICKNICIYLGSNGLATITGADIDNGSYDNCALDPLNPFTASQTSFSYADAGPNTITLTVLDINGNTSTCTSIVTVGEYYTLFGAGPTCSTPSGQPDACHVNIGNGNTVSGNVGSYRLITTGGGVAINGNVYSGGKVNYANGVSSKSVSAANLLGVSGLIFQTGNSAGVTGDVNVQGNININQNAGSFVTGIVRHPSGTTYSGPVPGGGVLTAAPILPALPGMPPINAYSCGGANITTTATLIPGSYGNITLGNAAGVVITFAGPGNYYFSRISMGQGGIHTFKYDFLGLPGKINIYVCGDIDFGTHYSQWANPNTPDACRVYFETHGTGSTNGTNSVMSAIIALGSQFYGRVWAPYGGIKIGSGSCCTYATGSFWSAKQVQLEGAVTIYRCGSACPPGPRIGQGESATAEEMKDMLQVYPNPTTGQTTVSFFAETPGNYSLKVMDYQGRVVLSNQIKSIAGDNTLEVDMSQFAKGLYMIEVGNTNHSQKVKLVVQ